MVAAARLAADEPLATRPAGDVPSRMVAPASIQPASQEEIIYRQVPDPKDLPDALNKQLARAIEAINANDRLTAEQKTQQVEEKRRNFQARMPGIENRIKVIERPREIRLSFADAMRRTLTNSYGIAAQSYNPAIQAARVVEAEAVFTRSSSRISRTTSRTGRAVLSLKATTARCGRSRAASARCSPPACRSRSATL